MLPGCAGSGRGKSGRDPKPTNKIHFPYASLFENVQAISSDNALYNRPNTIFYALYMAYDFNGPIGSAVDPNPAVIANPATGRRPF